MQTCSAKLKSLQLSLRVVHYPITANFLGAEITVFGIEFNLHESEDEKG